MLTHTRLCVRCNAVFRITKPSDPQKFCTQACFKESLKRPITSEAFWAGVEPQGDCLIWTGLRTAAGYGQVRGADGRSIYAHRYAWTLENGQIPPKTEVCHTCDNPACVKVAHLFLGTHRDNMRDMADKGRNRIPGLSRAQHPMAKLTEAQVVAIRDLLATGAHTHRAIAQMFGVSRPTITAIRAGRLWK